MEHKIEKKIKDLKDFIKQKTDQGTANYLGKELRELCGMVETEALRIHDVVGRSEQLVCTFCGINPMTEICKHPKVCSTKEKVKAN